MCDLNKFFLKDFNNKYMKYSDNIIIYHYTSSSGLDGILLGRDEENEESPRLWFSRYNCLNDISEGNDFIEIYNSVVEDLKESINKDFYELIKSIKPTNLFMFSIDTNTIEGENKILSTKAEIIFGMPYICCFSKNADALPMWNYYAKHGYYNGYNIGIHAIDFQEELNNYFGKGYFINTFEVIYENDVKIEIISEVLKILYESYNKGDVTGQTCVKIIESFMNTYRLMFKKSFFKHEEEFRAVIVIPTVKINKALSQKIFKVHYRDVNGFIVPYIVHHFRKDIVSQVNIGPMDADVCRKIDQTKILEEKLQYNGYSAKVDYSKIPVRY